MSNFIKIKGTDYHSDSLKDIILNIEQIVSVQKHYHKGYVIYTSSSSNYSESIYTDVSNAAIIFRAIGASL